MAPPASPWDDLSDPDAFAVSYRSFLGAYAPRPAAGAFAAASATDPAESATDAADGPTARPGPRPAASGAGRSVAELEWKIFKEWTARLEESFTLVHAAVLGLRGRAVVLAGRTGNGKTTLALALLARGWTFLSDDCAVLGPADPAAPSDAARVWPAPGAMHVKGGLSRSLAESLGGVLAAAPYPAGFFPQAEGTALCCLVRPGALAPPGRPWPVAAVVLLERRGGSRDGRGGGAGGSGEGSPVGAVGCHGAAGGSREGSRVSGEECGGAAGGASRPHLERLTPGAALTELVFHSFARTPERLGRDFRLLASVVRAVPCHRLLPADPHATAAVLAPLVGAD